MRKVNALILINVMKRIVSFFISVVITCSAFAQDIYVVTAAKGLNVRSIPSTEGKILGALANGVQIIVYNISSGWAEFQYKDRHAYVSAKYIAFKEKVVVEDISTEQLEDTIVQPLATDIVVPSPMKDKRSMWEYHTLYERNPNFWKKWGFDFIPSVYVGYGTFISSGSHTPKGICSFGGDANLQFYSKEYKVNYLAETSIGYAMKGTAGRPIHYFVYRISPCGLLYDLPNDMKLSVLFGIYIGASSTIWYVDASLNSRDYHAGFDAGLQLKVGLEYKNIGGYISYDQGFTDAMPDLRMSLINTGINFHFYYRLWTLSKNKIYTFKGI